MKTFYVASYGKNNDRGIYIMKFDESTLEIKRIQQIVTKDYPSYMITKNHVLYVAYKNASSHNDGGGIGSFTIHGDELILNNNYGSSGRSYTHLCVDENDRYVFAANYHVGATASYQLENKAITQKICAVHHKGLGPDLLKRQTGPHAHCVGITPDKQFVYSVDLGADKVVMYRYNQGVLLEDSDYTLNIVPGSGPRHMIFSHDGRFAYLVNEIANNIMVFKYIEGRFNLIQAIHCIPRHFKGFSSASAIRMTSSGDHLFVSNRGHDSIAMYRVNKETGKISLLYMVHTGKGPRDFNIIDDKYLIVGCQEINCLQILTFDEEAEKLLMSDSSVELPAPVCITFEN
ncbi:lactonase family protein [Candidatus Stoquefichus massiliensis]|uniref:lactonase family protein n=1 Tax=Candidatus Stoquefichus massiliensis TaxID=1470350 RepID=UPI0004841F76|nr:lactonase family protein [Candidatus Stoquefichus massiliensis]